MAAREQGRGGRHCPRPGGEGDAQRTPRAAPQPWHREPLPPCDSNPAGAKAAGAEVWACLPRATTATAPVRVVARVPRGRGPAPAREGDAAAPPSSAS